MSKKQSESGNESSYKLWQSGAEPGFPFGKIVGFRGLDGELKVRPGSNNPEILSQVLHLRSKDSPHLPSTDFEILESFFDKRMYYLRFAGYDDRNSVEHLMSAELYTWEDELLDLSQEEYWVKDLVGMLVVKESGEEVGRVVDIIYSGNDILEVRRESDPPGKTILIPFVKAIVPGVNLAERRLTVADVPGLFECQ